MPAIGITGGISTGKSTFCQCLREILPAAKFFDADQAAHQLVDRDPEVKKELIAEFGSEVFSRKGDLNRAALRAIIFSNAAKKSALEKILHPRIRRQWSAQAKTHRKSTDFFFADIPLLYETDGERLCDRVVVVACSRSIQLERMLQRGMGFQPASAPPQDRLVREAKRTRCAEPKGHRLEADATSAVQEMINSQMPLEEKISRADHVVWNNGDRSVLA